MNSEFQKRLPEFEVFDRIEMKIVPRYKQSELSGDEWRQHVEVCFYFKGELVKSFGCRDMEAASKLLGWHLIHLSGEQYDEAIPDKVRELEEIKCFQPSCCQDAKHKYYLKELFSSQGEKLDVTEHSSFRYYRKFCDVHSTRS
jgi:hypothetical protein